MPIWGIIAIIVYIIGFCIAIWYTEDNVRVAVLWPILLAFIIILLLCILLVQLCILIFEKGTIETAPTEDCIYVIELEFNNNKPRPLRNS